MNIDHRCPYITVAQQFLNRADIVIRLQEMACIAVAEGMRGNPLRNPCFFNGLAECNKQRYILQLHGNSRFRRFSLAILLIRGDQTMRRLSVALLCVAVSLLFQTQAYSAIFHVSTLGNDSASYGSSGSPCATIWKAINTL